MGSFHGCHEFIGVFYAGNMREETCPGDPKTFDQVEKERLLGNRNDLRSCVVVIIRILADLSTKATRMNNAIIVTLFLDTNRYK